MQTNRIYLFYPQWQGNADPFLLSVVAVMLTFQSYRILIKLMTMIWRCFGLICILISIPPVVRQGECSAA